MPVPATHWPDFPANRLALRTKLNRDDAKGLSTEAGAAIDQLAKTVADQSFHLLDLAEALDSGSLDVVTLNLENRVVPEFDKSSLRLLASKLRAAAHPASLSVSAAIWEIGSYFDVLRGLSETLRQNFVAVVGDAGFGKTFLAVEQTRPAENYQGGILLRAAHLPRNGTLDDLVRHISFGGGSFHRWLEAADAAGTRLGRRIPILIDGLNESENPREWKDLLATVQA